MAEIELVNQALVVMVSDVDLDRVSAFRWSGYRMGRSGTMYAATGTPRLYMHRLITRAPVGFDVDHRNGDGLDNRRENLRVCPHALNLANQAIQNRVKTSQYKGVSFDRHTRSRNKWGAYIKVNGARRWLGLHASEHEAAIAYNVAAAAAWGEYARLNIIEKA